MVEQRNPEAEEQQIRRRELMLQVAEGERRDEEIRTHRWGIVLSAAAVVIGFVTAFAAIWATLAARDAVAQSRESDLRTSREARISTGIAALGADDPAQRIAGLRLLSFAVTTELLRVDRDDEVDDSTRDDAVGAYVATLDAVENYVGSWRTGRPGATATPGPAAAPPGTAAPTSASTPTASALSTARPVTLAGLVGYSTPRDVAYAMDILSMVLLDDDLRDAAGRLHAVPSIDLSRADLFGLSLRGLDLGWLRHAFLDGIDLRGVSLIGSDLAKVSLVGADLRCANLTGVDLRRANLTGADLRGANLTRADLRGATLTGTDVSGSSGEKTRWGGRQGVVDRGTQPMGQNGLLACLQASAG